jgi:hypothetical protein
MTAPFSTSHLPPVQRAIDGSGRPNDLLSSFLGKLRGNLYGLDAAESNMFCQPPLLREKGFIIIIIMKGQSCFLFLDPQDAVGPSISSSVVLYSFVLVVYIVKLVMVFCLCPFSVRVVATFTGTVLFPLLCSVLLFFP